jgi:hypothetical protein
MRRLNEQSQDESEQEDEIRDGTGHERRTTLLRRVTCIVDNPTTKWIS